MNKQQKYKEIMKQLNYKPIGSVLLRLCGVVSSKINKKTLGFWVMITSLVSMLLLLLVFKDKQLFAIMYLPFVIGLLMYRH